MVPLVAVSARECVEALVLAGFDVYSRSFDGTTLVKGLLLVVVPEARLLSPEALAAVLRSAKMPYSEFLEYLSETPTEPSLDRDSGREVGRETGSRQKAALSKVPPSGDTAAS